MRPEHSRLGLQRLKLEYSVRGTDPRSSYTPRRKASFCFYLHNDFTSCESESQPAILSFHFLISVCVLALHLTRIIEERVYKEVKGEKKDNVAFHIAVGLLADSMCSRSCARSDDHRREWHTSNTCLSCPCLCQYSQANKL